MWRFFQKLRIKLLYDPTITLLGIYSEKTIIEKTHAGVQPEGVQEYLWDE